MRFIGFWSEFSCWIALWQWACYLASADLWFIFCRTEGEMGHRGGKTLKFSLLLRAHDNTVSRPFELCIHSWFDDCWPELWWAVLLEARSPDVPWLCFSHTVGCIAGSETLKNQRTHFKLIHYYFTTTFSVLEHLSGYSRFLIVRKARRC